MRAVLSCAFCTVALVVAHPSWSHPTDCSAIPNGSVNTCANCHVSASGGGTCTPFGEDVAATRSGSAVQWPALYSLDSDDDGQTNGQELGDPCGVWRAGATPGRTTAVSNPGDPGSLSPTPMVPDCAVVDGGGRDATDAAQLQRDSAVTPRDSSAVDTASGRDTIRYDHAAASDTAGTERAACTPICIDSRRLYSCSASGAHVETPCPSAQFCSDGVCRNNAVDGGQDGSASGCGCASSGSGMPLLVACGLATLLVHRRRR